MLAAGSFPKVLLTNNESNRLDNEPLEARLVERSEVGGAHKEEGTPNRRGEGGRLVKRVVDEVVAKLFGSSAGAPRGSRDSSAVPGDGGEGSE